MKRIIKHIDDLNHSEIDILLSPVSIPILELRSWIDKQVDKGKNYVEFDQRRNRRSQCFNKSRKRLCMKWQFKNRPQILFAYIMTEDYIIPWNGNKIHQKNDIFVRKPDMSGYWNCEWWKLATPKKSARKGGWEYLLQEMDKLGIIKQVNLEDYPHLYPHYNKEIINWLI